MNDFLDQFLSSGTIFAKDDHHLFVGYGKRNWSAEPNNSVPNWYFPDFFLKNQNPWFTHPFWEIITTKELQGRLEKNSTKVSLEWVSSQEMIFDESFEKLKTSFAQKKLNKAVPYLFQRASQGPTKDLIARMLSKALEYTLNSHLYIYGFWNEKEGILGATPEKLFAKDGLALSTMACAGTLADGQQYGSEAEAKKLLKEHNLVIEGMKDDLGPLGHSLLVGETTWRSFHQLNHLMTPIEIVLHKNIPFLDIVRALHPTPAIGTYPKKEGSLWLKEFDALIPRHRFGAPCACAFQNRILCLVAIRNVQWTKEEMQIGAGSGIIEESILEKEKNEIAAKIAAVKGMLGYE
ncbi:Salicylate biosynthesis isochorismate synthase [Chlamydiales bacterium STE3]|nr:Salicylate biosynthesis isochorismate synthase [Chlamydiales bacterium STE3]